MSTRATALGCLFFSLIFASCKFVPWKGESRNTAIVSVAAGDRNALAFGNEGANFTPYYPKHTAGIISRIHVDSPSGPTYDTFTNVNAANISRDPSFLTISNFTVPYGNLYMYLFIFNTAAGSSSCGSGLPSDCADSIGVFSNTNAISSIWTLSSTATDVPVSIGTVQAGTSSLPDLTVSEVGVPYVSSSANAVQIVICQNSGAAPSNLPAGTHFRAGNLSSGCTGAFGSNSYGFGTAGTTTMKLLYTGDSASTGSGAIFYPLSTAQAGSTVNFPVVKPLLGAAPMKLEFNQAVYAGGPTSVCKHFGGVEKTWLQTNPDYYSSTSYALFIWVDSASGCQ